MNKGSEAGNLQVCSGSDKQAGAGSLSWSKRGVCEGRGAGILWYEHKNLEGLNPLYLNAQGDKGNAQLLVITPRFSFNLSSNWGIEMSGSYYIRKTQYHYYKDVLARTFEVRAGVYCHLWWTYPILHLRWFLYLIQLSETAKNNCLDKELEQNALQTDKN